MVEYDPIVLKNCFVLEILFSSFHAVSSKVPGLDPFSLKFSFKNRLMVDNEYIRS